MKPWMKVMMWLGLGAGLGFFAGYQVGARVDASERASEGSETRRTAVDGPVVTVTREEAEEALEDYRGADTDGDTWVNEKPVIDELDEMDTRESVPVEIPQLHTQDMVPVPITEDEFNLNENELDIKCLEYYEEDEVLFDPEFDEIIADGEQLMGYGWEHRFHGDPNNPVEVIYIENETMGTIYRVELVHAAFHQQDPEVALDLSPTDDEEDDDEDIM